MEKPATQDTIKCAKCGRRNSVGAIVCEHCSAHLYIECPHCAHRSPRVRRSCLECGKPLRQGLLKKLKRWGFSRSRKHAIILTVLTILAVLGLSWIAFAIAEFQFFSFR